LGNDKDGEQQPVRLALCIKDVDTPMPKAPDGFHDPLPASVITCGIIA
jgi:hypothetical protein